ncbi:MAG: hypothetical protein IT180_10300 [Acidobacteria bacterium]|nr:hypothetical protein [Acidobacteriota bacterium]
MSELRIDVGPGYRVYFTRRGRAVIILLAGGRKHTQTTDIRAASSLRCASVECTGHSLSSRLAIRAPRLGARIRHRGTARSGKHAAAACDSRRAPRPE